MKKTVLFMIAMVSLLLASCSKKTENTTSAIDTETKTETTVQAAKNTSPSKVSDDEALLDDGEDGCYWIPVLDSWSEWGNKYLETEFSDGADVTDEWASGDDYSIAFTYKAFPSETGAAHFYCTDILETNWTDYNTLKVEVNNLSSSEITLQFYTKSGDTWAWSDTDALTIEPGVQSVEFDISKRGAAHKESIVEMGFVIYGATEDSALLIDDLRLAE